MLFGVAQKMLDEVLAALKGLGAGLPPARSAYAPPMLFPDTPPPAGFHGPDEDDSLIRWMLRFSPAERLQVLQGFVDTVSELRRDQSTAIQRRT